MLYRLIQWLFICAIWALPVAAPIAAPDAPVVLVLGDSLSAAYGMPLEQGWVALLQDRLRAHGWAHQVVNASLSGETTDGGLSRLPALLERHRPALAIIALGANDGLQGRALTRIAANLQQLLDLAQQAGAGTLLAGVRLPPNYGADYDRGLQRLYAEVAARANTTFVPRLLAGVAEDWALMQPDGLHPTAAAQPRILDNLWPVLEPLLHQSATPVAAPALAPPALAPPALAPPALAQ